MKGSSWEQVQRIFGMEVLSVSTSLVATVCVTGSEDDCSISQVAVVCSRTKEIKCMT